MSFFFTLTKSGGEYCELVISCLNFYSKDRLFSVKIFIVYININLPGHKVSEGSLT